MVQNGTRRRIWEDPALDLTAFLLLIALLASPDTHLTCSLVCQSLDVPTMRRGVTYRGGPWYFIAMQVATSRVLGEGWLWVRNRALTEGESSLMVILPICRHPEEEELPVPSSCSHSFAH